jgi:ribosome-binding ATPase YchF (GTP1/OBG family)
LFYIFSEIFLTGQILVRSLFPHIQCTQLVESNTPIQTGEFSAAEVDVIRDFGCITTKPQIYVVNLSQKNFIRKGSKWLPKIQKWVKEHGGGQILPVSCEFEQALFDLKDDPEAQNGTSVHVVGRRVVTCFESLILLTVEQCIISFLGGM